jgi:HEPN domain-containing protein
LRNGSKEAMFKAGRYIYTVFMCHLSIEKALKGIYSKKFNEEPKKSVLKFLLNISITTRYPDDIQKLLNEYDKRSFSIKLVLKKLSFLVLMQRGKKRKIVILIDLKLQV